jgi:hypothetical protein
MSSTTTMLPAKPAIIAQAAEPGRLALRLITVALEHGWADDGATELATRGRAAIQGHRWCADADLDNLLLRASDRAFHWLIAFAVPAGFELLNCAGGDGGPDGADIVALVPDGQDRDMAGGDARQLVDTTGGAA